MKYGSKYITCMLRSLALNTVSMLKTIGQDRLAGAVHWV